MSKGWVNYGSGMPLWYFHEDIRLIVLIWEVIFTVVRIKAWVRSQGMTKVKVILKVKVFKNVLL